MHISPREQVATGSCQERLTPSIGSKQDRCSIVLYFVSPIETNL